MRYSRPIIDFGHSRAKAWLNRFGQLGCLLCGLIGSAVFAGQSPAENSRLHQLTAMNNVVAAPTFTLPSTDGGSVRLSDYRDQVVVINFWSSWCMPCRREMPSLQRAWQRLEPAGIGLLAVAIQDDPEVVRRFLGQSDISFPVVLDKKGAVAAQWPFSGIPATFVIDRSGNIAYSAIGVREWDSDPIIDLVLSLAERP